MTLYVGGLNSEISEKDLEDIFYSHGEIKSIKKIESRNCAFVTYTSRVVRSRPIPSEMCPCHPNVRAEVHEPAIQCQAADQFLCNGAGQFCADTLRQIANAILLLHSLYATPLLYNVLH